MILEVSGAWRTLEVRNNLIHGSLVEIQCLQIHLSEGDSDELDPVNGILKCCQVVIERAASQKRQPPPPTQEFRNSPESPEFRIRAL